MKGKERRERKLTSRVLKLAMKVCIIYIHIRGHWVPLSDPLVLNRFLGLLVLHLPRVVKVLQSRTWCHRWISIHDIARPA